MKYNVLSLVTVKYRAITHRELDEVLAYLPIEHQILVRGKFELVDHRMADADGREIDGHYDYKTDTIIIYALTEDEINEYKHATTIWHEVGHLVFSKLNREERSRWEDARLTDSEFPFRLSDIYPKKAIWEEEFCFTYVLCIRQIYYEGNGMRKKSQKNEKLQAQIEKRVEFVKRHIPSPGRERAGRRKDNTCYRIVTDRFEKWAGKLKD